MRTQFIRARNSRPNILTTVKELRAFGSDFQATFLRDWLTWVGVLDISEVSFRPNIATDNADAGRVFAHTQALQLAKMF